MRSRAKQERPIATHAVPPIRLRHPRGLDPLTSMFALLLARVVLLSRHLVNRTHGE